MKRISIFRRVNDIIKFERLRLKTNKYLREGEFLLNKDIIFIVNLPATDYYYLPYFQLYQYKNVVVNFSYVNSNKVVSRLFGFFSKYFIYRKYLKTKYEESKKYIIFFDGQYTLCSGEFRRLLKNKYPGCNIIFHLGDLVCTKKGIKIEDIKNFSDLTVTYDHNDADNYKLICHPDSYSILPNEMLCSSNIKHSVIFYGMAKNRAMEILGVYDVLKRNNVDCDFCVPGLSREESEKRPELVNSHFIPYIEYLKKVQSSDCILEIIQKGSRGCTFRTWEAIVYNKKLITNNQSVKEESFYNPNYILVIDSFDSIDIEWLKNGIKVDYGYAEKLSPESCFKFYLDALNNDIQN